MGNIDLTAGASISIGGHEKRIRLLDQRTGRWVKRRECFDLPGEGLVGIPGNGEVAQLDITGAIAKALVDLDPEARIGDRENAVHTVAAPRMHLYAQQADRGAFDQTSARWISRSRAGRDVERRSRRRGHEALPAFQKCRPGISLVVHAAHHDERKLGVKLAMLVGHEVPHDTRTNRFHSFRHAEFFLDEFLALVPDG